MTREIDDVLKAIAEWDKEDVNDLLEMIDKVKDIVDEMGDPHHIEAYLDMCSLPSVEFPDDFDTSLVWAMDKQGRILVGEQANEITTLNEWLAE